MRVCLNSFRHTWKKLVRMLLFCVVLLACTAALIPANNGNREQELQNNLDTLLNYLNEGSPSGGIKSDDKFRRTALPPQHKRRELYDDGDDVEPVVVAPPLPTHKMFNVTKVRWMRSRSEEGGEGDATRKRMRSWELEEPKPVDLPHNRPLPVSPQSKGGSKPIAKATQTAVDVHSTLKVATKGIKFSKKPHPPPTDGGGGAEPVATDGASGGPTAVGNTEGGGGAAGEGANHVEGKKKGKSKRKSKGGGEGGKKHSGDSQPPPKQAPEKTTTTAPPPPAPTAAPPLPPPTTTSTTTMMSALPLPTAPPAQNYKLIYFDARGICEPIRLLFHYAKVSFEDARISRKQWLALKDSTVYGKVPILEVDGKPLTYCHTISRYLARTFGLAGTTNWEQAKVDEISDFHSDVAMDLQPYLYVVAGFHQGDREALRKAIFLPAVEKHFPVYVNILKQSGSGFFVSSGLTWIDFVVSEYMTTIKHFEVWGEELSLTMPVHKSPDFQPAILDKYPTITKFVRKVQSLPQIFDYIANREHQPV